MNNLLHPSPENRVDRKLIFQQYSPINKYIDENLRKLFTTGNLWPHRLTNHSKITELPTPRDFLIKIFQKRQWYMKTFTTEELNILISEKQRKKINSQKNRRKLNLKIDENGKVIQPYIYTIGLGEKHFKNFNHELEHIIKEFPWLEDKHFRFVMDELVLNSQCSMLRTIINQLPKGIKSAGYFFIKIFLCENFVAASIEEFGDYFDYYKFIENSRSIQDIPLSEPRHDQKKEIRTQNIAELNQNSDKQKVVLLKDDTLYIPDGSNKIGLDIVEQATDFDFYITSFFNKGKYTWKRIYFRIENDV